jgi:hypothetical protein
MKIISLGILINIYVCSMAFAQSTGNITPEILNDGVGAKTVRFDNTHLVRFIEIFSTAVDPKTGGLVAATHNSIFSSSGIPASGDTSPENLVAGLDFDQMKKDFGVLNVSLNGPKLWTPSWSEVTVGKERKFNGINAAWIAQLNLGGDINVDETEPYTPQTIFRISSLGWKKGTQVVLMDDASGNTWILKGFQLGLNPTQSYEQFVAAAGSNFTKLPKGWRIRVTVLQKDLTEVPKDGIATIMSDEFFNVYDKTGPGMSDYIP